MARSARLAAAWAGTSTGAARGMRIPLVSYVVVQRRGVPPLRPDRDPGYVTSRTRVPSSFGEEAADPVHEVGPVEPRPVPRVAQMQDFCVAAEGRGVGVCEVRREVRILVAPDDERRAGERAQPRAGRLEHLRRRAAVQAEYRALRPLVEVVQDAVEERAGHGPPRDVGLAGDLAEAEPRR